MRGTKEILHHVLVLVVDSVFGWDIESFVDLCFDVVSFVTALTKKFQQFISALFKIVVTSGKIALVVEHQTTDPWVARSNFTTGEKCKNC